MWTSLHCQLFLLVVFPLLLSQVGESGANEETEKPDEAKYCDCSGVECQCCVDFNITFVDLGGPGCVKMKYISQDEGIMVKVSYGDSQLHDGQVKGTGGKESSTCMDILLEMAQLCAKFTEISRTETGGLRTCATLEPALLGEPQDSYAVHLACFEMSPGRMELLPYRASELTPANSSSSEDEDSSSGNPISFLEAVNESAEDGIAWFTNFWGINLNKSPAVGNLTEPDPTSSPSAAST